MRNAFPKLTLACLVLLLLPALGIAAVAGLDSLTNAALARALDYLELRPEELGFDKFYAPDDTFRLAVVEGLMADPLSLPGWQDALVADLTAAQRDPATLLARLGNLLAVEPPVQPAGLPAFGAFPLPAPAPSAWLPTPGGGSAATDDDRKRGARAMRKQLERAIDAFVDSLRVAEADLDRAFAGLSAADRDSLLLIAPAFWAGWDDEDPTALTLRGALHRELGVAADTVGLAIDENLVLDLAARVDRAALIAAAQRFQAALAALLAAGDPEAPLPARKHMDGVVGAIVGSRETPWGLLVLGGPGPNRYETAALAKIAFLIEPGGEDVYRGRAASAVGGLVRPFGALVDLAGNDLYDSGAGAFALGGALLGVAALVDAAGDDVYRGGDGTLGAGFFGVGLLADLAGADSFTGGDFCQGAGAVGIGLLVSTSGEAAPPGLPPTPDAAFAAGLRKVPPTAALPVRYDDNDDYRAARYAQGFASTLGVGLLLDVHGNEGYRTGGRHLFGYHLPNDFQSLAQGYSIGMRARAAGGVGILIDSEGNDAYVGEAYAQGVGYWYSVGLLHDGGGNDAYHAVHYAQGAGVHLAVGSLRDLGGDDIYACRWGVTQGVAHDLGVGMLLDEGGNDYYLVNNGQGESITNSVGLFIDGAGNDFYATFAGGQGRGLRARDFAAPGIFLDLEGKDAYGPGSPGADGGVWVQDAFGVGMDLDRELTLPEEAPPAAIPTREDSLRSLDALFADASLWEVLATRERVRKARAVLIARGDEAIDYLVAKHLPHKDASARDAIAEIARAHPDRFAAQAGARVAGGDATLRESIALILGRAACRAGAPILTAMLADSANATFRHGIITALGEVGDPAAAPAIRPYLDDPDERTRIRAVAALAALDDEAALPDLVARFADPALTVRNAAAVGLERFGAEAVEPLAASLERDAAGGHPGLRLRTLGRLALALKRAADPAAGEALARARATLLAAFEATLPSLSPPALAAAADALLALEEPALAARVAQRLERAVDPQLVRCRDRARVAAERR
jgi:HEAT repeat protein